jgi:hypothetical protein
MPGEKYLHTRKTILPQVIAVREKSAQNKGSPAFSSHIKGTSIIAIPGDQRRGIQNWVVSSNDLSSDHEIAISSSDPASPGPHAFRISAALESAEIPTIGILLKNPFLQLLRHTAKIHTALKARLSKMLRLESALSALSFKSLSGIKSDLPLIFIDRHSSKFFTNQEFSNL